MLFDIRNYGAVADGKTMNTAAIQAAIDAAHAAGGGRVLVEDGVYMFGTVTLHSNVELHIAAGATLLGSPRCEDYPEREGLRHVDTAHLPRLRNACYIYAEECENIALTGLGTIDCNGKHFVHAHGNGKDGTTAHWAYRRINAPTPPRVVFFTGCKNVKIEDVTMVNQPAGWSYLIHDCDYVTVDKIKIFAEVEYPNNDGVHINCSRNVTVSNCDITCGDDCIVVRANSAALSENKVCERVAVTNCNLTSYASGIRIAWSNDGTIRNSVFSNIVMTDTSVGICMALPYQPYDIKNPASVDLGREATLIENLSFSNIVMDKVYGEPVSIDIAKNPLIRVEAIRNLYFSGIHARGPRGIRLQGREENHLDNIMFSDCTFEITDYFAFGDRAFHGGQCKAYSHGGHPHIAYTDRVRFNNTEFMVKF